MHSAGAALASFLSGETPKEEEKPKTPEAIEAHEEPDHAEPAESGETEENPVYTIKVDGKDVEVTLSELKNGYQRQADYTRKTMEVAETRKTANAEADKARAERAEYANKLQDMRGKLESALQTQQETNWEQLLQTDPVEYLKQRHLAEARQAQLHQVMAEQGKVNAQLQAEAETAMRSHLETQQQELLAKLPEWKDPAKAKADKAAIRDYLLDAGYSKDAIDGIRNANDVTIALKAMRYDEIMRKANAAAKKVEAAPTKVVKPGVGTPPAFDKRTSAYQRFAKTGNPRDAAALFAGLI